ncbi:GNAT family N-acetyltransferase [Gramella jeungdoensis]|uniref:GNAT family N-acetyltransferase n=1 Tax=Gramella jeungdoensis TaxID=708091 RepID=A0ABT0Z5I5_9FLAO|nr:GNAT family N-acetyltransferase [Gramella jeungdoensis]MCM8570480.1 GNAT family N-acetyltransferase [Gramella jeungdoensis]
MIIREANSNDIPEIVKVLKASLGVDDLPLSEKIWSFKHIVNPFGASLVLVAEEDKRIVGVRAFMRWEWKKNNKVYKALRAVDTATLPEYQGRGIFKKLTLKAVEVAKVHGNNFIFNTPNEQSRPGYLKMGWKVVGKVNVALKPSISSFFSSVNKTDDYKINIHSEESIKELCDKWNEKWEGEDKLFTPKSREFLEWRYEKNPLRKYDVLATDDFYIASYIKKRKAIREFRISECIYRNETLVHSDLNKVLKRLAQRLGAHVISFAPEILPLDGLLIKGGYGPILTVRELNLMEPEFSCLLEIRNWNNSIGDLELF